ncbi:MAG: sigma-70 family RNA polymerase sigma factor [Candidatus Coproplasma sp.]
MMEEQDEELFRTYKQTGDIKIRNKLVEKYMYVAEIWAKRYSGKGVEYDDLLHVAYKALILGIEKFDPDSGNKFTTYISPTIRGFIQNYFRDDSRLVRLPRKLNELNIKIKRVINQYYQENGVKPTVRQIAAILGEKEEYVIEAMECRTPLSLDTTVQGKDSDMPLYEVIEGDNSSFENFELIESLKTEIAKLSPIEQQVIKLRREGLSQAEVGKRLGVNQMSVHRTEAKALEKLRNALKDD